jgi:hypothetical protein
MHSGCAGSQISCAGHTRPSAQIVEFDDTQPNTHVTTAQANSLTEPA